MTARDRTACDLFVSYAHSDDRDGRVAQVLDLLTKIRQRWDYRPWTIFFDRQAIRTADDWERSIGGGLHSAGLMLALLSPAYFRSEWCRREWEEFSAREKQRGQPNCIFSLYLETDPDFDQDADDKWHQDLRRRQYKDLRPWRNHEPSAMLADTDLRHLLEELERHLHDRWLVSSSRPGVPYQSIPLPLHFVPRPEEMRRLKEAVLSPEASSGVVVSALFGLGGVGKSTLAASLVQDPDVRERFPDGILWATLGQQPETLSLLTQWLQALGKSDFRASDPPLVAALLRRLLQDRTALLIVDDAWRAEDVELFRVGGPRCQMLITSRESLIARAVGARLLDLEQMTPEQAVALLVNYLGRELKPGERELARQLADAVGCLPLALELVAAQVSDGTSWQSLLDDLRAEVDRLEILDQPGAEEEPIEKVRKRLSLTASLNLSLSRLPPQRRESFAWLGALYEDSTVSAAATSALWQTDERAAAEMLRYLRSKALLLAGLPRPDGSPTYRLHDVLHASARRLLTAPRLPNLPDELPGLGMEWSEAHGELLRRYRARTRAGLWHTVPADGYIHGRLAWHLVQARDTAGLHALLREETPEGGNGWFEANERLGRLATFRDDIGRAWRLADESFQLGRQGSALGLQCRYALVMASLNDLASNIPPALLAALVKHGQWPVELALAYARQAPEPQQQVDGLMALVPLLKETALPEALKNVRAIKDEWARFEALAGLAPHLPAREQQAVLAEALQVAPDIRNEEFRFRALARLAPHLPAPLLAEALEVARTIEDEDYRSWAIAKLAPYLPVPLLAEALQIARAIKNKSSRSHALAELAPHLSTGERKSALAEALQIARTLVSSSRSEAVGIMTRMPAHLLAEHFQFACVRALAALAAQLPAGEREIALTEALQVARAIKDESQRSGTLAELAPHLPVGLPASLLAEALQIARTIGHEWERSNALAVLASHLPAPLLAEALQIARGIKDKSSRSHALVELVPHLSAGEREAALAEALQAARAMGYSNRSEVLVWLAPHLPAPLLAEVLPYARDIEGEGSRSRALAALVPRMRAPLLAEALQDARTIVEEQFRSKALAGLAPHLPTPLLAEALQIARAIGATYFRNEALAGLAPHLPMSLLAEALQVARTIRDEGDRSRALAALLPHEALQAARAIRNERDRSIALVNLVPRLPAEDQEAALTEALQAVRAISNEADRSWALADLAPHLPGDKQEAALAEALQAARAIRFNSDQYLVLVKLAPHLPAPLLAEAFQIARTIEEEAYRSWALAKLAPYLPTPQLAEALQAARAIGDERHRSSVLAELAMRLPSGEREAALAEALQAARAIEDEGERSWALTELAPHLPAPLLAEAFQDARAIEDQQAFARVLVGLAPHLPTPLLAEALRDARAMSTWAHFEALSGLVPHLPAGEREAALAEALEDTRAFWWPHQWPAEVETGYKALAALALRLPTPLLAVALRVARAIGDEKVRSEVLAGLAPRLPAPLLAEALQAARAMFDEAHSRVLVGLAPHLPAPLLAEAFQDACSIGYQTERSQALAGLAPHLPAPLLAEAFRREWERFGTLEALAPHLCCLPRPCLSALWSEMLPLLASRDRSSLLITLRIMTPVLTALAGPTASMDLEEIATAIRDVGRWWP